ncbi:MFS transporter (putative signal transducer) [Agrobacterium vitis]|nr:MFS transporter (putative signal transducer) [Agrobacterium vitis]MBE1439467.1 MFS transporter (putative signal transducer) [Agrobacterium vitis]
MRAPSTLSLSRLLVASGGIYTAQSLVGGLTFLGVPAVLRAENVALDRIGLVSLAMLIWALKFLWSGPVERWRIGVGGRRRSRILILVGEVVVVLALIGLGFAGKVDFAVILGLLLLMALASATVDIACDAFLIEQFPENRRGLANVAQVGGGYLGMIFSSGLFVAAYAAFGWLAACLVLAGLVLLLSMPIVTVHEAVMPTTPLNAPGLLNALRRPDIRLGIVMVIGFELGGRLAQALAGPFLVDAGLPLATLGLLNGLGGVVAGLAGTAIGGTLAHRLGAVKSMLLIAGLHIASLGALAGAVALAHGHLALLVCLFIVESAVMAAGFVISYARLMALASPSQPGVDFTLFQCASAITAAICGMMSATLASQVGYTMTFASATMLTVIVPPLLLLLEHRLKSGNRFSDKSDA